MVICMYNNGQNELNPCQVFCAKVTRRERNTRRQRASILDTMFNSGSYPQEPVQLVESHTQPPFMETSRNPKMERMIPNLQKIPL